MKVVLKSDFIEYYDHWFDLKGDITFERFSKQGMIRREMFNMFSKKGLTVPYYGIVKDMKNVEKVVVYLDEISHRGENKPLMFLGRAKKDFPDLFCSEYIGDNIGESYRCLNVGLAQYWFRYQSNTWQSNYGNVEIEMLLDHPCFLSLGLDRPLWAIDFVARGKDFYAIDYNESPGVKDTGLSEKLTAKEFVKEIKDCYKKYKK